MILVFDTSIIVDIERNNIDIINKIKKLIKLHPSEAKITFITYYEFLKGVEKRKIKNKEKAIEFINKFGLLDINKRTAEILAELKIKYDRLGIEFSLADLLIAAQTIENQMLLVTKDKNFDKIKELNKFIL